MNEHMESIETVEIKDILPTKTDFALNLILGSNDMGLGHLTQKVLKNTLKTDPGWSQKKNPVLGEATLGGYFERSE